MQKNGISNNQQIILNIMACLVSILMSTIVSFFVSPYIVKVLGVEANGFITLSNNFVSYIILITVALNSMTGRFILIKRQQNNLTGANQYYTSVFIGNLFLVVILFLPVSIFVLNINNFINIPKELLNDVKILFALVFFNLFLNLGTPKWDVAPYITNKLYLRSTTLIITSFIRVVTIILLFSLFNAHVWFIALAGTIMTVSSLIIQYLIKRKITPELTIDRVYISARAIFDLVSSGIWNTVTNCGKILLEGFDLLIANIFIDSTQMGVLALAKTIPSFLTQIIGNVATIFGPVLTLCYAKNDMDGVKREVIKSIKIMSILISIPLGTLIIFGRDFFKLWVPSQNPNQLQILLIVTCVGLLFTSGGQCLTNVFTATNKLKLNSILIIISGMGSLVIVAILLSFTNLGIYAIAGVSSFVLMLKDFFFVVPYAAICIKMKWNTFYPVIVKSAMSVLIPINVGMLVQYFLSSDTWIKLAFAVVVTIVISMLIDVFLLLDKEEREKFIDVLLKK